MSVPYAWQAQTWGQLTEQQRQGRLPQALLVTGMDGIGKVDFCRELAATGLCLSLSDAQRRCGHCASCQQLRAGAHPDYLELGLLEGKREILIDQIRELCQAMQLTPSQSRGRYALIRNADRLNLAAANALLKTLEEPPRALTIMLVATRLSRLPATIRSRCTRVPMSLPTAAQTQAWLAEHAPSLEPDPDSRLRIGPCGLAAGSQDQASWASLERHWNKTIDELERRRDPLRAAREADNEEFDLFLSWWQARLLHDMRSGRLSRTFARLWDALVTVRSQGQGSFNRLLALEGLFILYVNLAAAQPGKRS